jgi:hypothetical protein
MEIGAEVKNMANIFHRPMFRRGGSVANGTGITSGLDQPRAKYADGPDEEGVNYKDATDEALSKIGNVDPEKIALAMDVIKSKLMPTPEESVSDFLTSFGSSAGSPTELQTWGSALGKTSQRYQALEQQKRQLAEKYAGIGAVSTLKSMTKNPVIDEMERKAELAAINRDSPNSKYKGMTYEQAKAAALNDLMNKKTNIKEFVIEKSPQAKIEDQAKKYQKEKALEYGPAKDLATIEHTFENDPKYANEKRYFKGEMLSTQVERTADGKYKLKDNVLKGPAGKNYEAGDIYYDPKDRTLYQYKGSKLNVFEIYSLNKKQ